MRGKLITHTLLGGLAIVGAMATGPRVQADQATTMTAIALAESGGRTDAKRPAKGMKARTGTKQTNAVAIKKK